VPEQTNGAITREGLDLLKEVAVLLDAGEPRMAADYVARQNKTRAIEALDAVEVFARKVRGTLR
jgi:hypothetical protein